MLYSPFGYFRGTLSVFFTDPAFTSSVSRAEIVEGSMPLARERAVGDMLGNSVFPIRWEKYVPIRWRWMSVLAGSDVFGSLTITLPLLSSIAIRPFAFSTASAKRSSSVTTNCFSKSLLMATHGHSSILLFLTLPLAYVRGMRSGRCKKWDALPTQGA